MNKASFAALPCAAALAVLAGCSSPKAAYEQENFAQSTTNTFSRKYDAPPGRACDAGRRALLSQGYNIDKTQADMVAGHKNFQDEDKANTQITVTINCTAEGGGGRQSLVFANAVQDDFSMKKSASSASVGVSVLGAVSLPVGSSDDSLVKTSSLTVTREAFYGGFFDLLQHYLPQAREAPAAQAAQQPAANPAQGQGAQADDAAGPASLSPANTGVTPPARPAGAN